ncbi:MAG: glycosyltransferase family 2 protein [Anaerolineaceae bacterium]|nr:glycosyltransferase family 2 protein [Anaerolineaceae bacterium]
MSESQKPTCSVVIPVYNSDQSLVTLAARLGQILPTVSRHFELILVNDGSQDKSWEVIQDLSRAYDWVRGIHLMRNYGQHNALLCGVRAAQYNVIITMDDDLQHPPEELPKLLSRLAEGYDVVYGFPRKLPHSFWRNWFSRLTKHVLAWVMGIKIVGEISAFRAFRTELRQAFAGYQSPAVIIDVLLSWATTRFTTVLVEEMPRPYGRSNYNFAALVRQSFLILTGFSTIPLRLASWLGFIFTVFGMGIFLYVLLLYFLVGSIPGFPFLASIISLFSGTQLFTLGIFGEYLARIFDRSMDRPTYVIGATVGIDAQKS